MNVKFINVFGNCSKKKLYRLLKINLLFTLYQISTKHK